MKFLRECIYRVTVLDINAFNKFLEANNEPYSSSFVNMSFSPSKDKKEYFLCDVKTAECFFKHIPSAISIQPEGCQYVEIVEKSSEPLKEK